MSNLPKYTCYHFNYANYFICRRGFNNERILKIFKFLIDTDLKLIGNFNFIIFKTNH